MVKAIAAAAGVAGVLVSLPVQSQGIQLQMSDNDLSQYCFWNGRIFSLGSFFCVEKNRMLLCNVSNNKEAREDRASWSTVDRNSCSKSDIPKLRRQPRICREGWADKLCECRAVQDRDGAFHVLPGHERIFADGGYAGEGSNS